MDAKYSDYLKSAEWKAIGRIMRSRAGNKCELCHSSGETHVHHKSYKNIYNETLEDLIVLCANCHSKFHDKLAAPVTKNQTSSGYGLDALDAVWGSLAKKFRGIRREIIEHSSVVVYTEGNIFISIHHGHEPLLPKDDDFKKVLNPIVDKFDELLACPDFNANFGEAGWYESKGYSVPTERMR